MDLNDAEIERIAEAMAKYQPGRRRSPWLAPSIVLGIIIYVAPLIFIVGKFADRMDNLEAATKQNASDSITEKNADIQFKQLRDDMADVKEQLKALQKGEQDLAITVGHPK